MISTAVAEPKAVTFTTTEKLFVAQSLVSDVVAMGERQVGVNVYVSPPMGNFAGEVVVKRILLALTVPAKLVSQVSVPVVTLRFFTWANALVAPRKPLSGWFVTELVRSVTAE